MILGSCYIPEPTNHARNSQASQCCTYIPFLSEVQVEQCRRSHHLKDGFVGDIVVSWLHFRVQVSR